MSSSTSSELHNNILDRSAEFRILHSELHANLGLEDLMYRFYHQSYKVYNAQYYTERITKLLESVAPERTEFCQYYVNIFRAGTDKKFDNSHNQEWEKNTRPIIEAFLHASYFLDMAVKYIDTSPTEEMMMLGRPTQLFAPGWAALLELYGIR